jgi:hypothetical protein
MYALAINAMICILLAFLVAYLFSVNLKISAIEEVLGTDEALLRGKISETIDSARAFNMIRSYTIKGLVTAAPTLSGSSTKGLGLYAMSSPTTGGSSPTTGGLSETKQIEILDTTFNVVQFLTLDEQHERTREFIEDYSTGRIRQFVVAGYAFVTLPPGTVEDESKIPIAAYNIGNLASSVQLCQNALVSNNDNKSLKDLLSFGDSMGVISLAVF